MPVPAQKPSTTYSNVYAIKGGGAKRTSPWLWVLILLLFGALGAAGYFLLPKLMQPAETVKTAAPTKAEIAEKRARIRPKRNGRVTSEQSVASESRRSETASNGGAKQNAIDVGNSEAAATPGSSAPDSGSDEKPADPPKDEGKDKSGSSEQ